MLGSPKTVRHLVGDPRQPHSQMAAQKAGNYQNGLPWLETWTKTCSLPLLFSVERHPNMPLGHAKAHHCPISDRSLRSVGWGTTQMSNKPAQHFEEQIVLFMGLMGTGVADTNIQATLNCWCGFWISGLRICSPGSCRGKMGKPEPPNQSQLPS